MTLPLVYLVTVAGIVGLVRARRRRGAELLLLEGAYFTVVSVAVIAVPRLARRWTWPPPSASDSSPPN